jgi:hypothetical protein
MDEKDKTLNRVCSGDCVKCNAVQQIYCSSQISLAVMKNQETFETRISNIEKILTDITELLKSDIINPLINQKETAPDDSGVDNTGQ